MNCSETHKLLHGYLDNELELGSALALQEHLRDCSVCTAEVERLRVLRDALRDRLPRHAPPASLARDVHRALRAAARPPSSRRRWFFSLAFVPAVSALAIAGWLLWPTLHGTGFGAERYVYHINNLDNAAAALQNIQFHLEAAPQAQFVVVTHNSGVDFLMQGAKDGKGLVYEPRVQQLSQQGVKFSVCNNTLRVRHLPVSQVVHVAQIVPSGIAEVGRLQAKEGYIYLKP